MFVSSHSSDAGLFLFFFVVFFLNLQDKLYGNHGASNTGSDSVSSSGTVSGGTGYGTFYPSTTAVVTTYTSAPVSSSTAITTNEGSYQSMPAPGDQESPYSYGYGDEKNKMLTQGQTEGQSADYSMYTTSYPTSVTGGQAYSSYGGFKRVCV